MGETLLKEISMNVRQRLKQSKTIVGVAHHLGKMELLLAFITKRPFRSRFIKKYLDSHEVRKLHLGAGPSALPGWLSTDITFGDSNLYLNATQTFPFEDNTFDYVYSEHMIEHIPWHNGLFMLKECRRILKPKGTIRIATPDLEVLIGLYVNKSDTVAAKYIEWITDRYLSNVNTYKGSFVINNAFRSWGHQFLYDGDLLELAMQEAGLTNIRRYSLGESNDANLKGIESHGKNINNNEMALFETMILEGECP